MAEKIKILKDSTERQAEEDDILERHPDWPQLDVKFYFASHGNARDMEGVAPHLAEADILLYENTGRTPKVRKQYDHASQNPTEDIETLINDGNYKGLPLRGHSTEPLLRGIYKTGKAVGTLDVGSESYKDSELLDRTYKALRKMANRDLSYKSALIMTKNNAREVANTQAEREERMVENFEDEIEFIFKTRPDLVEKETVNILITIGSFHTSLGRRFANHGISSTRDFSAGPDYKYSHKLELQRDFMYGITPSDELLKDALSEDIVMLALGGELVAIDDIPTEEIDEYIRRYVSDLSDEEREKLYELYHADRLTVDAINDLISVGQGRTKLVKVGSEIEKANKNHRIRVKKLGKAVRH